MMINSEGHIAELLSMDINVIAYKPKVTLKNVLFMNRNKMSIYCKNQNLKNFMMIVHKILKNYVHTLDILYIIK